jgi:hypothetical protein
MLVMFEINLNYSRFIFCRLILRLLLGDVLKGGIWMSVKTMFTVLAEVGREKVDGKHQGGNLLNQNLPDLKELLHAML